MGVLCAFKRITLSKLKSPKPYKTKGPERTLSLFKMVGTTGFEPATSSPPAKRATKLRQVPVILFFHFCSPWGDETQCACGQAGEIKPNALRLARKDLAFIRQGRMLNQSLHPPTPLHGAHQGEFVCVTEPAACGESLGNASDGAIERG